jgi:hypothetical protein
VSKKANPYGHWTIFNRQFGWMDSATHEKQQNAATYDDTSASHSFSSLFEFGGIFLILKIFVNPSNSRCRLG